MCIPSACSEASTWHMAMYYYASKISAIACGTHCRQNVLRKSRGQRDRDKEPSSPRQDSSAGFHFPPNSEEDELNGNYATPVAGSGSGPGSGLETATNDLVNGKNNSGEWVPPENTKRKWIWKPLDLQDLHPDFRWTWSQFSAICQQHLHLQSTSSSTIDKHHRRIAMP